VRKISQCVASIFPENSYVNIQCSRLYSTRSERVTLFEYLVHKFSALTKIFSQIECADECHQVHWRTHWNKCLCRCTHWGLIGIPSGVCRRLCTTVVYLSLLTLARARHRSVYTCSVHMCILFTYIGHLRIIYAHTYANIRTDREHQGSATSLIDCSNVGTKFEQLLARRRMAFHRSVV